MKRTLFYNKDNGDKDSDDDDNNIGTTINHLLLQSRVTPINMLSLDWNISLIAPPIRGTNVLHCVSSCQITSTPSVPPDIK